MGKWAVGEQASSPAMGGLVAWQQAGSGRGVGNWVGEWSGDQVGEQMGMQAHSIGHLWPSYLWT